MKRSALGFYSVRISVFAKSVVAVVAAAITLLPPAAHAEEEAIPSPQGFDRYAKMLQQSLFAPVTQVPVEVPEEKPVWSAPLFVVGVLSWSGKNITTIGNRDTGDRFNLEPGKTTPDGIALVNVEYSKTLGDSKVTIRKGSEFATLGFDRETLTPPLVAQNLQEAFNTPSLPRPEAMRSGPNSPNIPNRTGPGVPNRTGPNMLKRPSPNVPNRNLPQQQTTMPSPQVNTQYNTMTNPNNPNQPIVRKRPRRIIQAPPSTPGQNGG